MNNNSKHALKALIVASFVCFQALPSSAHVPLWITSDAVVSIDKPEYQFSDLLDALHARGQLLIDFSQGQHLPAFTDISLGNNSDYENSLQRILSTQGLAFEMHGPVMLVYDVKERSDADYPLNRKITNLKLTNVTIKQCFAQIAQQLNVTILGDGPRGVNPMFNIEFNNVTLQEALLLIVSATKTTTWTAFPWPTSDDGKKAISIQIY